MTERWWALLAQDPPSVTNTRLPREGDEGEARLLAALGRALSDDFLAIPGAMVEYKMDADVIVIGRNGIWVIDSKYFAGTVSFGPGGWAHEKEVYIKGGRGARETVSIEVDDLSEQWQREQRSVDITLKKNMKGPFPKVVGGLAFTYPGARLDIAGDCPVAVRTGDDWATHIASIPDDSQFDEQDLIECAHWILTYSHKLDNDQTGSALAAADTLNESCLRFLRSLHENS
jgi:hypothetical protein